VKPVVTKYAIAIEDEWFTGFSWVRGNTAFVGRDPIVVRLMDRAEAESAVKDLERYGYVGQIFIASFVKEVV
jgi:hypothetical protein